MTVPRSRSRSQQLADLYQLLGRMQSHTDPNAAVIQAIQKRINELEKRNEQALP